MMLLLPAPKPRMRFMSLFSGVGGFDLGFERAGMTCVGMCELNKQAMQVLNHRWPYVNKREDVRHVTRYSFEPVDLICGGFPCQDVSVAGRRAGLAGERSGLWFEFHRIIDEIKPQWVVIENVPGLLTSNGGADFETVLSGLVGSGYRVGWRILDSQYFGVAQRRRRVFIVASLRNGRCAQVLFEREGSTGSIEPCGAERKSITTYAIKGAAIGRRPEAGPQYGEILENQSFTLQTNEVHAVATFQEQAFGVYAERDKASTLSAMDFKSATDLIVSAPPASGAGTSRTGNERTEASFLVPIGLSGELTAETERVSTLNITSKSGGGHPAMVAVPTAFSWHTANRMSLEENKTPTLTVSDRTPLAGQRAALVRRLTPRECERLQGFPDDWTLVNGMSDSARYRMMGNAVTVNVAEWIGKRILEAVC